MVRFFLFHFANYLERLCCAIDESEYEGIYVKISYKLCGTNCLLATWSYLINEKYNLGAWDKQKERK